MRGLTIVLVASIICLVSSEWPRPGKRNIPSLPRLGKRWVDGVDGTIICWLKRSSDCQLPTESQSSGEWLRSAPEKRRVWWGKRVA